ncbi:MAG TPA: hypothetical protein DDZ89_13025 [Clostridiales bacterium]|nr:hypothetical protein [Clostridiales bacterium]
MNITGKLLKNNRIISMDQAINEDTSLNMTRQLEACLLDLCKSFNIPLPIWMKKNTKEFAHFKKTVFTSEQFLERVNFDSFVIEMDH